MPVEPSPRFYRAKRLCMALTAVLMGPLALERPELPAGFVLLKTAAAQTLPPGASSPSPPAPSSSAASAASSPPPPQAPAAPSAAPAAGALQPDVFSEALYDISRQTTLMEMRARLAEQELSYAQFVKELGRLQAGPPLGQGGPSAEASSPPPTADGFRAGEPLVQSVRGGPNGRLEAVLTLPSQGRLLVKAGDKVPGLEIVEIRRSGLVLVRPEGGGDLVAIPLATGN